MQWLVNLIDKLDGKRLGNTSDGALLIGSIVLVIFSKSVSLMKLLYKTLHVFSVAPYNFYSREFSLAEI
jgi:hypothetical protein